MYAKKGDKEKDVATGFYHRVNGEAAVRCANLY